MAARPPPPPGKPGSNAPAVAARGTNTGVPNQTLYVKNLNDKINRDDLKRTLYLLFSTYGPVLDIVTCRLSGKGKPMRGQAHICFRDIQTSTQAMRALQGVEIFEKEMQISYARGTSHIIPKLRGTFEPSTTSAVPVSESTELQKSIFNAPPSSIPTKPISNGVAAGEGSPPHGIKRTREEESDIEEVEMEEDDDDDAPMEEDDDD